MRQLLHNEFLRFVFTGGVAAIVNWLSRILYSIWLDYGMAVIVAYLTGMVTAYLLFSVFVFSSVENSLPRSITYYLLVNAFALLLTWFTSLGLGLYLFPATGWNWYPLEIAHAIGVTLPVFNSYFGHKYFSFR